MTLYFSRIRLARNPSTQALASLLTPSEAGPRHSAQHKLLWAAFADGPDRRRDFLWREDHDGTFLTLSARPPQPMDLFAPHEVKPFAPALAPGQMLDFVLRANATRMKRDTGRRVDVVMDALHDLPKGTRAPERLAAASREGAAWLGRQGAAAGFRVDSAVAGDYATVALPGHRGPRKGQPQFGILDLEGRIEVTDPAVFLSHLARGFGRAKAFGCGLMLIRRAP
ncbi:type I-E CRISPR-associated protein Cas6/Cse3/CasE [Rhodovulum adriaticum]|uniref:CRISPR-associated Cse3 family protein n=1 Tax=Rhodovulum adriaticum TaxID=35804 RepID=A0A4R2P069_RHOAD|nr:type I-E CRISPR-associated protein Cas6/Cse3/CasE [Rhodovulum adriaticum]MBK1634167.1 type I-E CRISPR-associated protein Cas6/Cse3/CasE [Rhodovulum adriaticum]TCP27284.1 CRISPR-associated Cse3 family protein [Rhodovulum adriaticum]